MNNKQSLVVALIAAALLFAQPAVAQNVTQPLPASRDALSLDATVFNEVIPDLAVITLAAEAQGADAALFAK